MGVEGVQSEAVGELGAQVMGKGGDCRLVLDSVGWEYRLRVDSRGGKKGVVGEG